MPLLRSLLASALLLSLGACAATMSPRSQAIPEGSAAATSPPAASPEGVTPPASVGGAQANDNVNTVAWMQTSVEYRLIAGETWRAALAQLDRAIKAPGWDALAREDRTVPATGLPPAVIVDIDETVLDNLPFQARLLRDNVDFHEEDFARWIDERAARPVPGALEFARAANARGVTIYYISNRKQSYAEATLANLRAAGFPVASDEQFMGAGFVVPGCTTTGSDKGCRRQLVARTHRVLLQVGDQLGDMVSIASNNAAGREAAVRPYLSWVGERWFVLPNPAYGSWESSLFGNDWTQPAATRRQHKLDALRY
ncbi:MAG: HAD family acid phosphatase [Arenimonas sp.]